MMLSPQDAPDGSAPEIPIADVDEDRQSPPSISVSRELHSVPENQASLSDRSLLLQQLKA